MSLRSWFINRVTKRPPDFIIGDGEKAYLKRWWVIPRNKFFNVYLHHFRRSDDDRALHSHPWAWNASWLLEGSYREHLPGGLVRLRTAGSFVFRWGAAFHRVELLPSLGVENRGEEESVWTLFLTGNKCREWGFACPKGFVHWKSFTNTKNYGEVGAGCGDN